MKADLQVNGRHVLVTMLLFFAAVIAVNAVFIIYAVRSYPGEKEEKSYRQGLRYNAVLADRAQQNALGWRASIDEALIEGGKLRLVVSLRRRDESPLDALDLSGALTRPASGAGAQPLDFASIGGGRYESIVAASAGAWDLTVTASSADGDRFEFSNRVIFQ